jgi:pimeloyl-ACP methyl ester carboxylesterase
MSSATPKVVMSAFRNYMGQYVNGQALEVIKRICVPVVSINARLWPTHAEGNRKQIQPYRLFYIEETGHFPMLEKPAEFNRLLVDALKYIKNGS